MPPEKKIEVLSSFQAKHPRIYTIIYQFLLLIITFYCAVAISRYGPEGGTYNPSSVVPEIDIPRPAPSDENSTTPHICKHGAREDLVDVGPLAVPIPPFSPEIHNH
jgi:hypothetical protein